VVKMRIFMSYILLWVVEIGAATAR